MVITKILFSFTENMSYLNSALKQVFSWLSDNLGNILFLIFIGLVTVLVAQSVNRLMEIYLKRMNTKLDIDISTLWMFRHFTVATIYLIGFIIIIFRNDETIISSISVTDIVFDVYLGKWNYRAIPKVKTLSYFLTIP